MFTGAAPYSLQKNEQNIFSQYSGSTAVYKQLVAQQERPFCVQFARSVYDD